MTRPDHELPAPSRGRSPGDRAIDPPEGFEGHRPATVSPDDFKALFRGHPTGVAVITADAGDGPVAITASSVASVSAEPPLVIFSIATSSSAAGVLSRSETVVVHLLDTLDIDLAKLGAASGVDRFEPRQRWSRLTTGEPLYRNVRAWVRCAVINRIEAGASTVFLAHALQSHVERNVPAGATANALVHHNRAWHRLSEQSIIEH